MTAGRNTGLISSLFFIAAAGKYYNILYMDRFTLCLEDGLLAKLDAIAEERGYPSRSQAVGDFIRRAITRKDWKNGHKCAASVSVIYKTDGNSAAREIERVLAGNRRFLKSVQTVYLDDGEILVVCAVAGVPGELERLADALRAVKGVTHGSFSIISPL